jgi:tRNA (guanine-N7-)-methyltransferase
LKTKPAPSVFFYDPETVCFYPENYFAPLNLEEVFPTRSGFPLEIDLGCGDGSFLVEMAKLHPDRNFIGVERLLGRVRVSSRKAARVGVKNVRLLRVESHYLVQYLLPPSSVDVIHVMCPDPWPKRRHQHNRLIQTAFLDVVHSALRLGGELRLTTDDQPYYQTMRQVFCPHPGFIEEPWDPGPDYPQTDFERAFRAKGLPIYRALLRKRLRAAEL